MNASRPTPRLLEALALLDSSDRKTWTPAGFAAAFWPDKTWARSNGPWGLGPDASGRHGGRILSRLHALGLVDDLSSDGVVEYSINQAGRREVTR